LNDDVGECVHDPSAFICHAFARPMEIKEQLVRSVAASKRPRLKQLLASQQRLDYTRLEELKKGPRGEIVTA